MPVSMTALCDDLAAESAELRRVLAGLSEDEWRAPTPAAGWTIGDQVSHLAYFDDVALRSATDEDAPRPVGHVPSTTLWWVDGGAYLGRLAIRHRLTPHLLEYGGHIGYDVRPTARRRGHATAMLAAALPVANRLGIDRALVTCDTTNVASRRVIEANGGVLEDERGRQPLNVPHPIGTLAPSYRRVRRRP